MQSNSNWRLEAISIAARAGKQRSFNLKNGVNTVGHSSKVDIPIRSSLCSRRHCQISVTDDHVYVHDTSTNGTYISIDNSGDHYCNRSTDKPLQHNDIISFGFNILKVYNIEDKNACVYRLIKDKLDLIHIVDSDDEEDDVDNDVVVVLDSDSDKELSDKNSELNNDEGLSWEFTPSEDDESDDSLQSDNFSSENQIINLDDDEDDNDHDDNDCDGNHGNDTDDPNGNAGRKGKKSKDNKNVESENVELRTASETDSKKRSDEKVAQSYSKRRDDNSGEPKLSESETKPHTNTNLGATIEKVKVLQETKNTKHTSLTQARPLQRRKRKRTITEAEYEDALFLLRIEQAKIIKAERAEKLAQLAQQEKDKVQSQQSVDAAKSEKRSLQRPKVKITQCSRGERLATEFLSSTQK